MKYTIKQVSEMTGLPMSTLRYYDKEGLLPALEHRSSGYRIFHDIDLQNIEVIECFKKTGMEIKDIKDYMRLFMEGECTWEERQKIFQKQIDLMEKKKTEIEEAIISTRKKMEECRLALESGKETELRKMLYQIKKEKEGK